MLWHAVAGERSVGAGSCGDSEPYRGAYCHSDTHTIAYSDADGHARAGYYTHTYSNGHARAGYYTHTYSNGHARAGYYTHTYSNKHAGPYECTDVIQHGPVRADRVVQLY